MDFKHSVISQERATYNYIRFNRYQKKQVIIETIKGWSFLSPLLVVAIIFSTTAIVYALYFSFQQGTAADYKFVGLKNWKILFSGKIGLLQVVTNTFVFAIVVVPLILGITIFLASIINSKYIKRKKLFLSLFFFPQVTSAIVSTIVFRNMIGPDAPILLDYITDPKKALVLMIVIVTWGGVAGNLITINTAFATIDNTQYEAAEIDGANAFQRVFRISMSSIMPVLSYSLFMSMVACFGIFAQPYMLKGLGVPDDYINSIVAKAYELVIPVSAGSITNIGLGISIMFFASLLMAGLSIVANAIAPINKGGYNS